MAGEINVLNLGKRLFSGDLNVNEMLKGAGKYMTEMVEEGVKGTVNGFLEDSLGDYGTKAFSYVSDRAKYLYIKNMVGNVLKGGYTRNRRVNEVPLEELQVKDAIGMHYNEDIYIPLVEDVPKIFGNQYKVMVKLSGKGQEEFNKDVQNYILAHELVESWYMEKYGLQAMDEEEHGKMEAMVLRAYREFSEEGYDYADRLHTAALNVHGLRGGNDTFRSLTEKYGGFAKAA